MVRALTASLHPDSEVPAHALLGAAKSSHQPQNCLKTSRHQELMLTWRKTHGSGKTLAFSLLTHAFLCTDLTDMFLPAEPQTASSYYALGRRWQRPMQSPFPFGSLHCNIKHLAFKSSKNTRLRTQQFLLLKTGSIRDLISSFSTAGLALYWSNVLS